MTRWVNKHLKKHIKVLNQRLVNIMRMKGRDQNFEQVKEIMNDFGFIFQIKNDDSFFDNQT